MKADSLPGELVAVISRGYQAFTPRESTSERMSVGRQLVGVIGRSRLAFGGNRVASGQARSPWAVTLFALSVILSIIEIVPTSGLGIHLAVVTGLRDRYPGLFATASLIVIVCAAPLIHYQRIRPIRHLIVPLAAVAGVLAIARWPSFFPGAPAATSMQVLAIAGLVWVLAKMLLLQRYSTVYCSRVSLSEDELDRLLPSQWSYLQRLRTAIYSDRVEQGSRVVQLVGHWGQGKSFLIERLDIFLRREARISDDDNECAVVVVNVWEQQSEPDLHLAIVEQILSHEKYWYPYGWMYYPLSLFVGRTVKELRLALSAGKSATKAEVQIPLTLPKPTGRRYLAQQVARVRERGTRTVVVLDEIDRATPHVAQSAMTFSRRSLDMPGIVIVLSYVDQVIRYKAFNPLVKSLPDLASTMHAVVFDQGPESAIDDKPGGPLTESNPASLRKWEAWQSAAEPRLPRTVADDTKPSEGRSGEVRQDATCSDDDGLAETLRLAFANAGVAQRRQLQDLFSERYLGTDPIQMRRLELQDVASVVVGFDTVKDRVLALLGSSELDEGTERNLVQVITSALRTLEYAGSAPHEPPTLRRLEGALLRRFSGIDVKDLHVRFSHEFIAAVVLTAYDAAARGKL